MSSRLQKIAADRLGDDRGSALVTVILVTFLLAGMVAMLLQTGEQAARSSARGKNFDAALTAAEAGVDASMARIEASGGVFSGQVTGQVASGSYTGTVSKTGEQYVIDVKGTGGGSALGRSRRVRATLAPPKSVRYALQSTTAIELKNNDTVDGDVWANDSVLLENDNTIKGSVTAAQGWVLLKQGSRVNGNVWSGGFHSAGGWAIRLETNASIEGWAKASVSDPNTSCPAAGNYDVVLGTGARVNGDLTTCDLAVGAGYLGTYLPNAYTQAAVPRPIPQFTFNPINYDAATYHEFSSVAAFQTWLAANKTAVKGTFYVSEPGPSQSVRIDLTGATVTGDTTIVTNAPIFTNGIADDPGSQKHLVLVSHYQPPTGAACSVNHDASECAVHVKNNFDPSCATAVLIYADQGPVAIKNNQKTCGSVVADSILVKNNQEFTYDERVARITGFGASSYEIAKWEEIPA